MKTGNIGIRNLGNIGVADIDVYGTDASKKALLLSNTEKIKLRIGVFFDGTGNNKDNSDSVYYSSKKPNPLLENEIPQIKHKGFKVEPGSSYWNSYSNIALLHDLYEEKQIDKTERNPFYVLQIKFYIQGIGTQKDEKDDAIGSGLGEGSRGVIARVHKACEDIADRIETVLQNIQNKKTKMKIEIHSIEFDVFGFSRGAAAARHFCNEVLKTGREELDDRFGKLNNREVNRKSIGKLEKTKDYRPEINQYKADALKKEQDNMIVHKQYVIPTGKIFTGGYLGKLLKDKKISFPKYHVSVEFLGIFDTVISQILEKKGAIDYARNPITKILATVLSPTWWLKPASGALVDYVAAIKKVNPNLKNPNIRKILHIKALNEWRENFPITPVGEIEKPTFSNEISVLGAHSDIGGGYWQAEKEINKQIHFFDLSVDASAAEKQIMEEQKTLLRAWYISNRFCNDNQIKWKTMHHVRKTALNAYVSTLSGETELLEENVMGNETYKIIGGFAYSLLGYHYMLQSERPLSNKLSLVYMNVMKYMAAKYADVPLNLPFSDTPHPEEYEYPQDTKEKMREYEELIKNATEHGWTDKNGKLTTYPKLVNDKGIYALSEDTRSFILKNYLHLSANFNAPLVEVLDHKKIAYPNAPRFTDEKEYKNPPYERASYAPELANYDKL